MTSIADRNQAGFSALYISPLKALINSSAVRARHRRRDSGHSHVPKIHTVDGVLYLNSGSAGPRRFRLPTTLATIDITPFGLRPIIHDLGGG